MENELSESKIMQALDWAYDKSINGFSGVDSARDLARDYSKDGGALIDNINSLIRWQNTKAATSGFIMGIGGIATMPIAVPANIASVLFVQVRMVAAIAIMSGHDVHDDRVKTLVYACLAYNSVGDALKDAGVVIGTKMATKAIEKHITGNAIKAINNRVGFKLLTKFGQKGVINLGKLVPVLGGVIGGSIDLAATNTIGNVARDAFATDYVNQT